MLSEIINEQASVLFSSGIAQKAMAHTTRRSNPDCVPIVLRSRLPGAEESHYFIGLRSPDRTKLVAIGRVGLSGEVIEASDPFNDIELLTVADLSVQIEQLCRDQDISYDLETGALT